MSVLRYVKNESTRFHTFVANWVAVLRDEGLVTLLCEVESIINGRPITTVSGDSNDPELLTPNHLLFLRSELQMPPWVIPKGRLLLPTQTETSAISRRYLLEEMV